VQEKISRQHKKLLRKVLAIKVAVGSEIEMWQIGIFHKATAKKTGNLKTGVKINTKKRSI
jgi:hypothetical protein